MSAPSFSSFPDLEVGSVKGSNLPEHNQNRSPKKYIGVDEQDSRRSRNKKKNRAQSPSQAVDNTKSLGYKGEHYQHSKGKQKRRSRSRSRSREKRSRRKRSPSLPTFATEEINHRLFYTDTKGDPLNIQYGGLYAGDVPKYHLVRGGRQILGLPGSWAVHKRTGNGIELHLRGENKLHSLTDSGVRALLAAPTRRLLHSDSLSKYEEIDGFIRLLLRHGSGRPEDTYRAITHRSDSVSDSTSNHDQGSGDSDPEDGVEISLTSHQEKMKSLEQELALNPQATDKWLLLLSHTLSTTPLMSKNAVKARSEITISILGRALSLNPNDATSKLLRLKYLKAGEEVWHESKIRAEWEDTLKVGGVEIWMEWLEFRIRNGRRMRKEGDAENGVVEDAVRVMNELKGNDNGEMEMLRVFWRIAVALQNAGYVECATAMFQAQAELSFNTPFAPSDAFETQLDALEEFWDSEVPRVGEVGARGFSDWYNTKSSPKNPSVATSVSASVEITDLDPYRQWAAQESHADRFLYRPTRSSDDVPDSDPYSTILFSDIRPFLQLLCSSEAKDSFRLVWLSFLGLHIPGFHLSLSFKSRDINWDDRWNLGYITSSFFLNALFPGDASQKHVRTDAAAAGVVIGREKWYADSLGPVQSWGYNVLEPLEIVSLGSSWDEQKVMWWKGDINCVDKQFVRMVFEQLRQGNEDDYWDMMRLAFEAATSVRSALKQSKIFLSGARNTLAISYWGAHAQLERFRGRLDEARKIYQTVLIASKPLKMQRKVGQLWWNWADMEWLAGQEEQTLNVIFKSSSIEGDKLTGLVLLRVKRSLEEAIRSATHWKDREAWIKLLALLELITSRNIGAVFMVFDNYLTGTEDPLDESLTVACLLMVFHFGVTLKNSMSPVKLYERVEKALQQYPSNSVIMGLFLEGEKGQGVWGRVRGMLGANDGVVKDVKRRIMEVWIAGWEGGRWSSEIERTRSGLSVAVEHERTRASPIIWRIYLEFELRAGDLQRAKRLLLRAIGECPLVKELYLFAFGPLRGVFDKYELIKLADTMVERGIRLRQGLDEVLKGWVDDEKNNGNADEDSENEDSGDEIEHNARELRRLMPY